MLRLRWEAAWMGWQLINEPLYVFGRQAERLTRKKRRGRVVPEQASLFGFT